MSREQMIDDAVLSSALLRTDAGRAAVAQAWIDGVPQKQIARAFGLRTAAPVCQAIQKLCLTYCPECVVDYDNGRLPSVHGGKRKGLAVRAIAEFRRIVRDQWP